MSKKSYPIFKNADNISGYVGIRCSNTKIQCTYMNGSKKEIRKYYDKVINYTIEDSILKANIMDYKKRISQVLISKMKIKDESLSNIHKILLEYL